MIPSPANSSSLSTSSSTIPSKSSHTSIFLLSPSSKSDENSLPTSAPPESMNGSSRRWPPHVSSKRKRDSEPRGLNGLQLREAQEKVAKKRAKIAARVPAMAPGNARPASTAVTSLADLYAQMHRDSGASGQQPASSAAVPSTKTVPGNGPILDGRARNAPRDHSTSSPDPIAVSEDDQEIVVLKHISGSPRERASFKPEAVLPLPIHSQSPSKDESKTSAPKSAHADSADKFVDKSRKRKLSFAVVVPSPPKRSTYKPARVEQDPHGRDSSELQGRTPAAPNHVEKSKGKKVSEPFATRTPTPAPTRPTRPSETILDPTPEYGMKRSRRGMAVSEDLTAREIDLLLDAVPVPFDFSLARHHLASREKGENDEQIEESSLWWYDPIFEARAKADIRRTLGGFLPSDPAQDPPFPIGSATGDWKSEMRPRQSRARIWAERLVDAFGPGPLDRGLGRKPRRVARPAGATKREAADRLRSRNGFGALVVITNSHRSTPRILEPPSRRRSPKDAVNGVLPPLEADGVALVDAVNVSTSESEAAAACAWTAALLPLVKGKTTFDKTKIARTSDALGEVEHANERGSFAREVLKESALADTVRRLGELDGVPFGDVYGLRVRARTLTEQWREMFGDEVVDLQRGVLLHVS